MEDLRKRTRSATHGVPLFARSHVGLGDIASTSARPPIPRRMTSRSNHDPRYPNTVSKARRPGGSQNGWRSANRDEKKVFIRRISPSEQLLATYLLKNKGTQDQLNMKRIHARGVVRHRNILPSSSRPSHSPELHQRTSPSTSSGVIFTVSELPAMRTIM